MGHANLESKKDATKAELSARAPSLDSSAASGMPLFLSGAGKSSEPPLAGDARGPASGLPLFLSKVAVSHPLDPLGHAAPSVASLASAPAPFDTSGGFPFSPGVFPPQGLLNVPPAPNMAPPSSELTPVFTTPDGDIVPAPVIIDWGEPFEISFGTRTTGYGDVKFLVTIRYLGAPENAQDQVSTIELFPDVEPQKLGKPQDRRLNARIVGYSNTSIGVDAYGDGTVNFDIVRESQLATAEGAHEQRVYIYRNGESHGSLTLPFKSGSPGGIPAAGTGTLVPASPETDKPLVPPSPDRTQALPIRLLIQLVLDRLTKLKSKPFNLVFWAYGLQKDLEGRPDNVSDVALEDRLLRLLDLLTRLGPVFQTVDTLSKDQYLGDLTNVALAELGRISTLYGAAVVQAYNAPGENQDLQAAEKALGKFPATITSLYLVDPRGVRSFIDKIPALQDDLRAAQDLNDPHYEERLSQGHTRLDELTLISWRGRGPGTLYDKHEQTRQDAEWAWRGETNHVQDRIQSLYADVQTDIGLLTAMTLYEQLRFFSHELSSSLINKAMESDLSVALQGTSLADKASNDARQLLLIVDEFWDDSYLREGKREAVAATLEKLKPLLQKGSTLESDMDSFQSRLKWVDRIDFVAKLALIVAVSTLTSGAAASVAGAELTSAGYAAYAGLGRVVVGGLVFTATDRPLSQIAFGKTEGTFLGDWFWNTVTFGVMHVVDARFMRADPFVGRRGQDRQNKRPSGTCRHGDGRVTRARRAPHVARPRA